MTTISALAPPTAISAPVAANPDTTDSDAPGVDVPAQKFPDEASFKIAVSSIVSASNFFSLCSLARVSRK